MPNSGTYTVKAGDSLSAIARGHGCDWRELARLNGIADPDSIRPGADDVHPPRRRRQDLVRGLPDDPQVALQCVPVVARRQTGFSYILINAS